MSKGGAGRSRVRIVRRGTQLAFLALFAFLAFESAYPPLGTPPANLLLRLDPLAAVHSLATARSASAAAAFWPAWALLGLTALSGRFFCAWLCPLGTCFDLVGDAKPESMEYYRPGAGRAREMTRKRSSGGGRRFRVKYLLLALVLALGIAGVNMLYFASPMVLVNRSLYYVFIPQVPVLLLLLLVLALAYRPRYYCDELCPMGALMSLFSMAGRRLKASFSPLSVLKDADSCVYCGACYRACDFGVAEPFLRRESGRLRSADCTACGDCVAACPSAGALSLASFGISPGKGRAAGSGSRPGGGRALSFRRRAVKPAANRSPGRLEVSRSEFLGSLGLGAALLAGYGLGLRESREPVLRMPGAQDERRFAAHCNRCGECARACPAGCLRLMGLEAGLQKMWTPRFEPRTAGCVFDQCDQACARVCPAAAIERQAPEEVRIGVARLDRRRCLGWKGEPCLVCQERCRFNAIRSSGLRPAVDADRCTGCGACEQTCPTEPASIRVFARGAGEGTGGRRRRGTG